MKILVTADLHYDIPRSREPARQLIDRACAEGGRAIVLVGDTAGVDLDQLAEALDLFAGFGGLKLIVPGNHCLWCRQNESSMERYEETLPALVKEYGFAVLDHRPAMIGDVALVGSIGWYDYSFADKSLGIPNAFYQAKVAPGAASIHRELLDAHQGELTDRAMAIRSRWMDGKYIRLGMSDQEFCRMLADRLAGQLADMSERAQRIIVFMHHLPFAEMLPKGRGDSVAWAWAYLGAEVLGKTLLAFPKVTDVYCGHSHWHMARKIGQLNVINVGSTYSHKRLEVLEI